MLRVKSVVILKGNPGILKRGGGIKLWMWLCLERENYLGFRNSWNEEDRKKCCETKKMLKYMTMDQNGSESSRGGGEG